MHPADKQAHLKLPFAATADERHLRGTAALLQVRKQRGYPQDQLIERAARQPIVSRNFDITLSIFEN